MGLFLKKAFGSLILQKFKNQKEDLQMKRKYLALMLAGVMAFAGAGGSVFAEEAQTEALTEAQTESGANEVYWEDIAPSVEEAGWEGEFVAFDEIAIQMFVPSVLKSTELTDEDKETGYIAYYMTDDETSAVSVMYVDVQGMDLAQYQEYLEGESDVAEIDPGIINGIEVLTYTIPEKDTACVSIATQAGYILEFAFTPMSDEGFASVAQIMMASIQEEVPAEAETQAE